MKPSLILICAGLLATAVIVSLAKESSSAEKIIKRDIHRRLKRDVGNAPSLRKYDVISADGAIDATETDHVMNNRRKRKAGQGKGKDTGKDTSRGKGKGTGTGKGKDTGKGRGKDTGKDTGRGTGKSKDTDKGNGKGKREDVVKK